MPQKNFYRTVIIPNSEFSAPNDTIEWCAGNWLSFDVHRNSHGERTLYSFNDITAPAVYCIGRVSEDFIDEIAVDKIVVDNVERKRYISSYIGGLTVVEGLGYVGQGHPNYTSNLDGCDFLQPDPPFVTGMTQTYPRIYRIKNAAGEVIYRTKYDKENSVASIIADDEAACVDIYSVQGILLKQGALPIVVKNLDSGLYIIKHYNATGENIKTSKIVIK